MHVGILTGGGDCPGLNAVIRAVTLALIQGCGARVSGIERGFMGLMEGRSRPLNEASVRGLVNMGGTFLGTHNKANPFKYFGAGGADCSAQAVSFLKSQGIDALVAIGGDGTMTIADKFCKLGVPVVGVPKTIDNDLALNDRSFGFDSAVAVVAESLGRLETTARSHGRVMILETMGRYSGWIALEGGLAGGADAILLPEQPYNLDNLVALCEQREREQGYTLICVAEGAKELGGEQVVQQIIADSPDPLRLGGVGQQLMNRLGDKLAHLPEIELRHTLLGHLQRGGSPTPFDRVLATRFGVAAANMVMRGNFGRMVALQGDACKDVALSDVAGRNRVVPLDHELMAAARSLGVCLG